MIYRLYMVCRYPGAARQPEPSSIPVLVGGAGTAMPGSSPLSSDWDYGAVCGKKLETASRKGKRCMPETAGRGRKENRKESAVALVSEEYSVPRIADVHTCCRRAK